MHTIQAEGVEEAPHGRRERLGRGFGAAGQWRRRAKAGQVDGDHVALRREPLEHRLPDDDVGAERVDEEQRLAAPVADVVQRGHPCRSPPIVFDCSMEQEVEDVYAMFQVNLVGLVHLTRLLLPAMVERGRGKIVNNASISGYAWFPSASTYAASKAGVVAFSESLRRELKGTGVSVLHLVTPGVATDMLDATRQVYGRHMDAAAWDDQAPADWAAKVVHAIERDDHVLGPGGRLALAKLASRGPAALLDTISGRLFTREPR